jgi:hypothetical protein
VPRLAATNINAEVTIRKRTSHALHREESSGIQAERDLNDRPVTCIVALAHNTFSR